ncbi:hypothetical protein [Actinomadura madurae]|uniref:hypothetical protein n=1 Tax=Actinomadura madurae TaxID=1993 RepID=UPI0020D20FD9|nr:hypothetical protein [Actinomadura madurae]MCP9953965.1 hypothetical protein [Actinomadura madurae]MCP9970709.1 hypothetical protein [Actinomadura madurae]MCP9983180.1 hypothetical protein [Actinomadura madurae]MCQ0005259.1 hypothetical protein [Actinomadura madurae]MCQ0019433.1 hypothetical protein [Actinomadura madurae]
MSFTTKTAMTSVGVAGVLALPTAAFAITPAQAAGVKAAPAAGAGASAVPGAGAGAARPPNGWNCRADKDTDDGDPGGSSGWTRRRWKFSDSNFAEARFAAKGEKFGVYNGTKTSVGGTLYVKYGSKWKKKKTLKLTSDDAYKVRDLSIKDGRKVYMKVWVHKRGSCKSHTFTA